MEAPAQAPRAAENPAAQLVGPVKGALHVPTLSRAGPTLQLFNLSITSCEERDFDVRFSPLLLLYI